MAGMKVPLNSDRDVHGIVSECIVHCHCVERVWRSENILFADLHRPIRAFIIDEVAIDERDSDAPTLMHSRGDALPYSNRKFHCRE